MAYSGYNSGYTPSSAFSGTPSPLRTVRVAIESRVAVVRR